MQLAQVLNYHLHEFWSSFQVASSFIYLSIDFTCLSYIGCSSLHACVLIGTEQFSTSCSHYFSNSSEYFCFSAFRLWQQHSEALICAISLSSNCYFSFQSLVAMLSILVLVYVCLSISVSFFSSYVVIFIFSFFLLFQFLQSGSYVVNFSFSFCFLFQYLESGRDSSSLEWLKFGSLKFKFLA